MKVSISWLKELVNLKVPIEELIRLLPLRTIGLKDVTKDYIELDMKGYNRADLLSLRGIAYEVAAITNSKVKFSEEENLTSGLPKVNVKVENINLAPVYCIAKIENLKVEHSGNTWVKKLNDSGIRSVNNVADITNLIMLEYDQPMHAFDAKDVENETIIVRTAKPGEKLVTLDRKNRVLTADDLLITDPKKAIGLAGVMGGKNSEVSNSTSTILLEAAVFDPKTLRKTAAKLGLISEASKRFYHGLTKKRLLQSLSAAIKMYEGLGGKLTAITIIGNTEDKLTTIKLSQEKINSLIGVEIPQAEVETSLQKLGFKLASHLTSGNVVWNITVPYWRLDINIEEDLIEEVARMYGYEKIPAIPLNAKIPDITPNPLFDLLWRFKQALSDLGLTEVQTYSYYSTNVLNNLALDKTNLIKIANPISSETEYLRNNIWPNLLEAVGKNIKNGYKDIGIFEIGKTYKLNHEGRPEEKFSLSIALMNNTDNPLDELYQIAENLCGHLGGPPATQALRADVKLKKSNTPENIQGLFHPNRFMAIESNKKVVGNLAEVHLRILNKLGIENRVAVLEINL